METLKLTTTPIADIIRDGRAEQSPIAESFFQKLRRLYGLEPVACYADCRQIVRLRETGRVFKKTTAEGAERVNELRLTLYLRGIFLPEAFDSEQKACILAQFLQTVSEAGQQLDYPRSYTNRRFTAGSIGLSPNGIYPDGSNRLRRRAFPAKSTRNRLTDWHFGISFRAGCRETKKMQSERGYENKNCALCIVRGSSAATRR